MAKKVRNVTLALNKERSLRLSQDHRIAEMTREIEHLNRDLKLIASPAARAAATRDAKEDGPLPQKDIKKDLAMALKQVEDLRQKLTMSGEECKRLQRALIKEIGDGTSLEEVLDDGWKGRAQQILLLKNKIKRLEEGSGDGSIAANDQVSIGTSSYRSIRTTRRDVDSKAERDLVEMSNERQRAVEQLTADHARISSELDQTREKCERYKVRTRSLETEISRQKENLKMMVDKGDSDDQLVEALKDENAKLREGLQKLIQNKKEDEKSRIPREGRAAGVPVVSSSNSSQLEAEIIRLNRLVRQQADQLETQETLIRNYRSAENSRKYS